MLLHVSSSIKLNNPIILKEDLRSQMLMEYQSNPNDVQIYCKAHLKDNYFHDDLYTLNVNSTTSTSTFVIYQNIYGSCAEDIMDKYKYDPARTIIPESFQTTHHNQILLFLGKYINDLKMTNLNINDLQSLTSCLNENNELSNQYGTYLDAQNNTHKKQLNIDKADKH